MTREVLQRPSNCEECPNFDERDGCLIAGLDLIIPVLTAEECGKFKEVASRTVTVDDKAKVKRFVRKEA